MNNASHNFPYVKYGFKDGNMVVGIPYNPEKVLILMDKELYADCAETFDDVVLKYYRNKRQIAEKAKEPFDPMVWWNNMRWYDFRAFIILNEDLNRLKDDKRLFVTDELYHKKVIEQNYGNKGFAKPKAVPMIGFQQPTGV